MGIRGRFMTGVMAVAITGTITYWYMGNKIRKDTSPKTSSNINIEKPAKAKEKPKTLYIGFIPHRYPPDMMKMFQHLESYLERELDMPVEVVTRINYEGIIDALVNSKVDVCLLGAYAYTEACKETKISPMVRRIKYGSSFYQSIMIVREDSGISGLEDLEEGKIAFTDRLSTSGYLLPRVWMKQRGIDDPNKYFSEVIFSRNDSALSAVNNKRVDAAFISSTLWQSEKLDIKTMVKNLKIIWKSEAVPLGPFCVDDKLDRALVEKIKKAFLKICKTADTKEICRHLKTGGIEGFEEAMDSDYDVIRNYDDILKKYEAILKGDKI